MKIKRRWGNDRWKWETVVDTGRGGGWCVGGSGSKEKGQEIWLGRKGQLWPSRTGG